jgi:hypothetical protein
MENSMSKEQAYARAQTLAYLTVANLWLAKPETIKDVTEKKS